MRKLGEYAPEELQKRHFSNRDLSMQYEVVHYFFRDDTVAILTIGDPDNPSHNIDDKVYVQPRSSLEKDVEMTRNEVHALLSPPGP